MSFRDEYHITQGYFIANSELPFLIRRWQDSLYWRQKTSILTNTIFLNFEKVRNEGI